MKKKILSKAAAVLAVGAIVTGLSGAMAVPASALTIEDDKDELMLYVAQKGAGKDITNDKIDTLFPVTYVYNG